MIGKRGRGNKINMSRMPRRTCPFSTGCPAMVRGNVLEAAKREAGASPHDQQRPMKAAAIVMRGHPQHDGGRVSYPSSSGYIAASRHVKRRARKRLVHRTKIAETNGNILVVHDLHRQDRTRLRLPWLSFQSGGAALGQKTISNFIEKASRLYEQERRAVSGAAELEMYIRRWLGWANAGRSYVPGQQHPAENAIFFTAKQAKSVDTIVGDGWHRRDGRGESSVL